MLDTLRSGAWLTRQRIVLIALATLCASGAGLTYLLVSASGMVDFLGRPLGTDFSSFYAAGTFVLEGSPEAPYDPARHYAREQAIFGPSTQFYSWFYPPSFLFVAGALALLPYRLALLVWQAGTLVLYLVAIRAILKSGVTRPSAASAIKSSSASQPAADRLWLLLALAFPVVFVNIGHGQNGFLTAALLGGALAALDRRPSLAGALFGVMAYKPQFGLMIPVALLAGGRWRSFVAAALTVIAVAAVTTLAFGPEVWRAFLVATRFARSAVLEQGDAGWYKMQSVFAVARMWGAPIVAAYAIQGALALGVVAALVWQWRSAAPYALKASALCLSSMLATPFVFDYDMMVLAPAIAFFALDGLARGFGPYEKTTLAALWIMPLFARSVAELTFIPLGVPLMLILFFLLLRRSKWNLTVPTPRAG